MTWTVESSGTTAALTIGVETVLVAAATTNATYVVKIDGSNLADASESVTTRIYTKVLTGGTLRVVWQGTLRGGDFIKIVQSQFVPSDFSLKVGITQNAGTGRTIDWTVLRQ